YRPQVPSSLGGARELFAASTLAREVFGDAVVEQLAADAGAELKAFEAAVTDWERVRGSTGCDRRRRLRTSSIDDGVRGDAGAPRHGDQARPAGAGYAAAGRAGAVRAARDRPLDAAP